MHIKTHIFIYVLYTMITLCPFQLCTAEIRNKIHFHMKPYIIIFVWLCSLGWFSRQTQAECNTLVNTLLGKCTITQSLPGSE